MTTPISARGIVKRFEDLTAVAGVDLEARAGECLGLLGPNGAGKTTTIEILEGIQTADEGSVELFGLNWSKNERVLRQRIGVQLQESRLPEKLKVFEILQLFRSFYDEGRKPEAVLELVGLEEKRDVYAGKLSGGQRQRLALGCALVGNPQLLFLDEPTTGLDPQARRRVWEVVEEFKSRGGSVLLTTHYMDEAELLSDSLIILDHGKTISEGSPRQIIDSLQAASIIELQLEDEDDQLSGPLQELGGVRGLRRTADGLELQVEDLHEVLPRLLHELEERQVVLSDLHTRRPTLEDVFVALTGRQLRDG